EKSMYQTISEEMISMFATIVDFNNLIGETVNRYRPEYKDLSKLRQLFFERIKNTPDLDKYVDYYKWIDHSITTIINQLMPATSNFSDNLRTMVESHILERNKHFNKIPRLVQRNSSADLTAIPGKSPGKPTPEIKPDPDPLKDSGGASTLAIKTAQKAAIRDGLGGYKVSQPPPPESPMPQDRSSTWWMTRAERSHPSITSGDAAVDSDRDKILSASSPSVGSLKNRGAVLSLGFQAQTPIHGGVNFARNKKTRYVNLATTDFGPTTTFTIGPYSLTASNNFVLVLRKDIDEFIDTRDVTFPDELNKRKYRYLAYDNSEIKLANSYDYNILKGDTVVPFNLYQHKIPVTGGYNKHIVENFKDGMDFTNIHFDSYGLENETPMQ
ncbi:MAG TPA: hypothetical protein DCM40_02975, partial [Maribacter sp.]|nr:hypothetical protein [Maribacter sp.]